MTAVLEAVDLDTYYGEYQVLRGASLSVAEDELVALFGPNGHGKSTLLKTICGMIQPKSGKVLFEGTDITRMPVQRIVEMGLVYVPEDRHLFGDMTILDNLRMGSYTKRARKRERRSLERVYELFPRLQERSKQLARTLSGGEAQMLAMGRGLMTDARFLAIDEPSLGLAPNLAAQIFAAIQSIKDEGIGVLLVEQSIAQACEIAATAYLMEEGTIVMCCPACDALKDERLRSTMLGL
jgi:branched-chain amino acid transport system ATP-binding protein